MDNLSPYLKEQYAAQKEQQLSQLKNAYDKNVQALDEKAAAIPAQYESAKNEVAAQNAIAKKNFNEQAAANGLNSGTSGQAELARSNAYMSALSQLNRSEAETQQALQRDRLSLQTNYENAIAAQNAANDAALNSALYQEMIRQQNAQYQADRDAVADAQWQKQYDEALRQYNENKQYQSARDAVADAQWQKQYDEALRQYEQNLKYQADRNAVEDSRWQAQFDESLRQYEDNLKYQADRDKIEDDRWQKQFEEAVRQYEKDYEENLRRYNQEYAFTQQKYMDAMGGTTGSSSSGSATANNNPTINEGGYNTHGYTTEEIKRMQQAAGIDVDGIWGPQTQAAYDAGYRPSVQRRQEELGGAYGTTAESKVSEMIARGDSESTIFAYIDDLTQAKYLTPSENTSIKLKIRAGKL